MNVYLHLKSLIKKYKKVDSFKKRGIIYISIAVLFMMYEFIFHRPPRLAVLLLWFGVIIIALFIITTLKDPRR
ncbi:hypothetical protein EH223_18300 [candidate division KSB1 bacterium]|nr:hypothetical protein [candidate division KSB1 bacterium]RQW00696.1 MAG: hypothetical protein EH223_18300 [candidate division KSB1 bacterium]